MDTNSPIQITRYWSVEQVARALDVHPRTIRRWVHRGNLSAVRVGTLIRISDVEFQKFVSQVLAPERLREERQS